RSSHRRSAIAAARWELADAAAAEDDVHIAGIDPRVGLLGLGLKRELSRFQGELPGLGRGRRQDEAPRLAEKAGASVVHLDREPITRAPFHLEWLVVPFGDQFVLAGDGQALPISAGVPQDRRAALAVSLEHPGLDVHGMSRAEEVGIEMDLPDRDLI